MVKKSGGKKTSKDLTVKDVNAVKGGATKAGGNQVEYLKVKLTDVLISGY
jgi:type VI protein secretion system component Hcp